MQYRISLFSFFLLSVVFAGSSYGWQGRMAGMGDPYGLVQDESDFLIHPSKIFDGKGVRFYANARYTYCDVTDWDYTLDYFDDSEKAHWPYEISGNEKKYDALLGSSFPLGSGRMGLIFEYSDRNGDYDGYEHEMYYGDPEDYDIGLSSDSNDFSLRFIYSRPFTDLNIGTELQIRYGEGENQTQITDSIGGSDPDLAVNYPFGGVYEPWSNLNPYIVPYDCDYWDAILKGSLAGNIGPSEAALTMHGGLIFSGDNRYWFTDRDLDDPAPNAGFDLDGDVDGWEAGVDIWLRYPVNADFSLPFVLSVKYNKKTWDAHGYGTFGYSDIVFKSQIEEEGLSIETGVGVDRKLDCGRRIAVGIYYSYLDQENDFSVRNFFPDGSWYLFNSRDNPSQTEHRVSLKLAGEKELSASAALRMGLSAFYGMMDEDYGSLVSTSSNGLAKDRNSMDGRRWGVNASVGGTMEFDGYILEPFLAGGFKEKDLDGDGGYFISGASVDPQKMKMARSEWFIGAGFSILFNH